MFLGKSSEPKSLNVKDAKIVKAVKAVKAKRAMVFRPCSS